MLFRSQELVATYQQAVLVADEEAENGLVRFLRAQERAAALAASVAASEKAVELALIQYKGGLVDFNRIALLELNLVQQQDLQAQAQGNIALGLIDLYRALGGGWEHRLNPGAVYSEGPPAAMPEPTPAEDGIPVPLPEIDNVPPAPENPENKDKQSQRADFESDQGFATLGDTP